MAGLAGYLAAGLAQGVGQGLVEKGKDLRDAKKAELERQFHTNERIAGQDFQADQNDIKFSQTEASRIASENAKEESNVNQFNRTVGETKRTEARADATVGRPKTLERNQAIDSATKIATRKVSDGYGGETTQFDQDIYNKEITKMGYPEYADKPSEKTEGEPDTGGSFTPPNGAKRAVIDGKTYYKLTDGSIVDSNGVKQK